MPQRLVLSDAAAPGDTFQIAVFGINGPISAARRSIGISPCPNHLSGSGRGTVDRS
jgi:hypothetical protein